MRETMTRGEWWDDAAPYGANGYQFGRGETVREISVRQEITFDMMPGDPNCVARGVAQMADGRVYTFTVLKPDRATERDGRVRVRLATLSRQPFHETARGLLMWEADGHRIDRADVARYVAEIDAL